MSRVRNDYRLSVHQSLGTFPSHWLDDALPESLRSYGLFHGAYHLHCRSDREGLWSLLRDEEYRKAQVARSRQYDASSEGLRRGLHAYVERDGETPQDDGRLCWLALRAGELSTEARGNVGEAFVWAKERPLDDPDRIPDALRRIKVLDEENYMKACLLLLWIEADRQADLPVEARSEELPKLILQSFDENIPLDLEISIFTDFEWLAWLALRLKRVWSRIPLGAFLGRVLECDLKSLLKELVAGGQALLAVEVVEAKTYDEAAWSEAELLGFIAQSLVDAGDFDGAMKLSVSIDGYSCRTEALKSIAMAFSGVGQFDLALDVAERIEDESYKNSALANIVKALTEVGQFDLAMKMAQCIRDESALKSIAMAFSGVGQFELALEVAESIEDESYKSSALAVIVKALSEAGQFEYADLGHRALDACPDFRHQINDGSSYEIAKALTVAGRFDLAMKVAQCIRDGSALKSIAMDFAEAGQFGLALEVAEGMEDGWWKPSALDGVAKALAGAGQFELALEVAEVIEDGWWKNYVLTGLKRIDGRGMEGKGTLSEKPSSFESIEKAIAEEQFDLALKIAKGLKDESKKKEALHFVAKALAEAGDFTRALEMADSMDFAIPANPTSSSFKALLEDGDDEETRKICFLMLKMAEREFGWMDHSVLLQSLAKVLAEAGQFDLVMELAEGLKESYYKASYLNHIVRGLADAGQFDSALKVAEGIEKASEKKEALYVVAKSVAEAGDFTRALEMADSMDFAGAKASLLLVIAKSLAEAEEVGRALDVSDRALKIAGSIRDVDRKANLVYDLAMFLAGAGQFDRALEASEGIEDVSKRTKTLESITRSLAQAGECATGKTVYEKLLSMSCIGWDESNYLDLVSSFAKAGDVARALKMAEGMQNAGTKVSALLMVAKSLADAGDVGKARDVSDWAMKATEGVKDDDRKDNLLHDLATFLARSGNFDRALDVVENMDDDVSKCLALEVVSGFAHESGEFDRLLETLHGIPDPDGDLEIPSAFAMVVESLAKAGDFDRALEVSESIDDTSTSLLGHSPKISALAVCAKLLAEDGQVMKSREIFDRAMKVADGVEQDMQGLEDIARRLAEAGDFTRALEVVDKNFPRGSDLPLLADFAQIMATRGENGKVHELCRLVFEDLGIPPLGSILEPFDGDGWSVSGGSQTDAYFCDKISCSSLASIAKALADLGDEIYAKEVYVRAIQQTDGSMQGEFDDDIYEGLSSIANSLAEAGFNEKAKEVFGQALDIASSMPDRGSDARDLDEDDYKALALSSLVTCFVDLGDHRRASKALGLALEAAEEIEDASRRTHALANISGAGMPALFDEFLGRATTFSEYSWEVVLPWFQAGLPHDEEGFRLLRRSLLHYPFHQGLARKGALGALSAYITSQKEAHFEAIIRECPQLELDFLLREASERN